MDGRSGGLSTRVEYTWGDKRNVRTGPGAPAKQKGGGHNGELSLYNNCLLCPPLCVSPDLSDVSRVNPMYTPAALLDLHVGCSLRCGSCCVSFLFLFILIKKKHNNECRPNKKKLKHVVRLVGCSRLNATRTWLPSHVLTSARQRPLPLLLSECI